MFSCSFSDTVLLKQMLVGSFTKVPQGTIPAPPFNCKPNISQSIATTCHIHSLITFPRLELIKKCKGLPVDCTEEKPFSSSILCGRPRRGYSLQSKYNSFSSVFFAPPLHHKSHQCAPPPFCFLHLFPPPVMFCSGLFGCWETQYSVHVRPDTDGWLTPSATAPWELRV